MDVVIGSLVEKLLSYQPTIFYVVYALSFIICGPILLHRNSEIGKVARYRFTCKGTSDHEENHCQSEYRSDQNSLREWLYLVSFFLPFVFIVIGTGVLAIKYTRYFKKVPCKRHINVLYRWILTFQLMSHLSVCVPLGINFNKISLESEYKCWYRNSTFECKYGKADEQSSLNRTSALFALIFTIAVIVELIYYMIRWRCKKAQRSQHCSPPNVCSKCHFFLQHFSPFQGVDPSTSNQHGEADRLSPNSSTDCGSGNITIDTQMTNTPHNEQRHSQNSEERRYSENVDGPPEESKGTQSLRNISLVSSRTEEKLNSKQIWNLDQLKKKYRSYGSEAEFRRWLAVSDYNVEAISGKTADSICNWALVEKLREQIAEDPDTPLTHDRHFTSNSLDNAIPGIDRITVEKLSGIGITDVRTLMKEFLDVYKGNEVDFRCWLEEKKITEGKRDAICNFLLAEIQRQREKQGNPVRKNLDEELNLASSSNE